MPKRTINDKYNPSIVDLDRGVLIEYGKEEETEHKLQDILLPFDVQEDSSKQRFFEITIKEVRPDYRPGDEE